MLSLDQVADGQAQGRRLRERDGGSGEARPPRADTVTLPSISLRREQDRGRCGAEPPHKGGRLRPTAQKERSEERETS